MTSAMVVVTRLGGHPAGAGPDGGPSGDVNRTGELIATLSSDRDGYLSRVVADTPMFLANTEDPSRAPRIGFVRAGTPTPDQAQLVQDGAYALVGVPFLRPSDAGTIQKGFPNGHSEDLLQVYLPAHLGRRIETVQQATAGLARRFRLRD